jgi:hypothetical protein
LNQKLDNHSAMKRTLEMVAERIQKATEVIQRQIERQNYIKERVADIQARMNTRQTQIEKLSKIEAWCI